LVFSSLSFISSFLKKKFDIKIEKQTAERQQADSRQTDVRTNRQTDTYRMKDRGADKRMDGQTDRQTYKLPRYYSRVFSG